MKNFVLFALVSLLLIGGFLHFNQDAETIDLSSFHKTIDDQNYCIDDLEESLYYVTNENAQLKKEIVVLKAENKSLSQRVLKYEIQVAKLRKRVTNLELDVNSARTKYHILKTDLDPTPDALVVSNKSEPAQVEKDVELDQFQQIIAEAKAELKNKKQQLIIAKAELDTKESILNTTKQKADKKEKALVVAETKLAKKENPSSELAKAKKITDELKSAKQEPKLYIVQSVEQKEINLEEAFATIGSGEEFASKSPVYNLIENTTINYEYISCRRDKFGKKIKKLNTKGKNWKFTFLQFNMDNPIFTELLEQNFRIKILDIDHKAYLPITTNRLVAYDDCHDFVYEGEPVQLAFYHEAEKQGTNYKVEVYLVDDEEEYLIEESSKKIFSEGISLDKGL